MADNTKKIKCPEPRVIKEQTGTVCVVRNERYDDSLEHILFLYEHAKKDFPGLKPQDVEHFKYGGDCISGTHGIEFRKPQGARIPKSYHNMPNTYYTKR